MICGVYSVMLIHIANDWSWNLNLDQENYQLIQTHQRKNCLQLHQHNLTHVQTYQQSNAPLHTL